MDKISAYAHDAINFERLSTVFEIFPAPLPSMVPHGDEMRVVEDAGDYFRASHHFGCTELYLPDRETVCAEINGNNVSFEAIDFVRWQLEGMGAETLYYLINKVDFGVDGFVDSDAEYDRDDTYDPVSWLSEYDEETRSQGLAFIERMRKEFADGFYHELVTRILDEDFGLETHAENEILEDFDAIKNYAVWDVKLGLIFKGTFHPYSEPGVSQNLLMDEYKLRQIWVRNYDES